jgi:hypothetical protein
MKTQSKIAARSGNKSRPAVQIHAAANRQQPPPDSGRPIPSVRSQNDFSIEEHLRVQREIEARAHRFWLAKGCALKNALNDWLKAEEEVLAEFVKARTQRQPVQPVSSNTQTKTGTTASFQRAVLHQHPAISKLKLAAAVQASL